MRGKTARLARKVARKKMHKFYDKIGRDNLVSRLKLAWKIVRGKE